MSVEIITKDDLEKFKDELVKELVEKLIPLKSEPKKWLKNSDVRRLLSVSLGTLQNLRINGTLRFTKIGGTMYYKAEDVEKMLAEGDGA